MLGSRMARANHGAESFVALAAEYAVHYDSVRITPARHPAGQLPSTPPLEVS